MKSNKKGFTIVELVIVVVIIAILAAVLIPTFANVVRTAQTNSDVSLVRNLNTALTIAQAEDGKNVTMFDALADAKEAGYDVERITPTNGENDILWDQENDRFVLKYLDGKYDACGKQGEDTPAVNTAENALYKLWKIYDDKNKDNAATEKFSVYWNTDEAVPAIDGKGFDAGEKTGLTVNLKNSDESKDDIRVRTNGGKLNVGTSDEIAKGQIWHYGTLDNAIVYTEDTCFHTHGKIADMDLKAGKAIAEDKGYVALLKASEGTLVEEKDTGVFYIPSGAAASEISTTVATSLGYKTEDNKLVIDETSEKGQERAQTLASTVYEISDKNELIAFRDAWNDGKLTAGMTFALTRDIDMSGYKWTDLIGNSEGTKFVGTFNGNHHKIINLSNYGVTTETEFTSVTAQTTGSGFGLFGYTGNAEIKNLEITVYGSGSECVAGLVADSHLGNLQVENITVYGSLSATKKVAGIVGVAAPYSGVAEKAEFVNCYNYATITSTSTKAAGIVASNGTLFSNCHNYGTINCSGQYCAGIGAWVANEYTYSNCTNEGTINCNHYYYYNLFDSNIITETDTANQESKDNYIVNYYRHVGIVENHEYNWEERDFNGFLVEIAYDAKKRPFKYTNEEFDYYYSDFNTAFNTTSIRVPATDHTYQIIYDFTSTTVQDTSKYQTSNYTFTIGSNVKVSCDFKVNINTERNFTINGNHSGYTGTIEFTSGKELIVGDWSTTTHGTYSFSNGTLQEPVHD